MDNYENLKQILVVNIEFGANFLEKNIYSGIKYDVNDGLRRPRLRGVQGKHQYIIELPRFSAIGALGEISMALPHCNQPMRKKEPVPLNNFRRLRQSAPP